MSANTSIEWTATRLPEGMQVNYKGELVNVLPGHTFNPWWGCVKVDRECQDCYAETWANRFSPGLWGVNSERRMFDDKHWNEPLKWNNTAGEIGVRMKVFCGSMCDVFEDNEKVTEARERLFKLIEATPNLLWLLLTKRPDNILGIIPSRWLAEKYQDNTYHPKNVWYGTSTGTQESYDKRGKHLIDVMSKTGAKIFLSCEPLVGPINLATNYFTYKDGSYAFPYLSEDCRTKTISLFDWIIVGGESGNETRRPMHPDWVIKMRDDCIRYKVSFFFKQWGEWVETDQVDPTGDIVIYNSDGKTRKTPLEHLCVNHNGRVDKDANKVIEDDEENCIVYKLGKKNAGRLLDGKEYDEVPDKDVMFIV